MRIIASAMKVGSFCQPSLTSMFLWALRLSLMGRCPSNGPVHSTSIKSAIASFSRVPKTSFQVITHKFRNLQSPWDFTLRANSLQTEKVKDLNQTSAKPVITANKLLEDEHHFVQIFRPLPLESATPSKGAPVQEAPAPGHTCSGTCTLPETISVSSSALPAAGTPFPSTGRSRCGGRSYEGPRVL
jgi:hypothetical protein